MFRRKPDEFVKRLAPGLSRLLRKPGDQIEADIANPDVAKNFYGPIDIRAAMHATGGLQFFIHERLRSETDAVDSRYQPVDSFLDINGLRVRLQCYFFQNTEERLSQGMNHAGKEFRQK